MDKVFLFLFFQKKKALAPPLDELYVITNMMTLRLFLTSLLSALLVAARGRARSVEVPPPWDHLEHLIACFERLYTDWRNGNLPEPCADAHVHGAGVVRRSRRSARVLPHTAMAAPPSQAPAASRAHSGAAPPAPAAPAAAPPCSGGHHPRAPPPRKNPPVPACRRTSYLLRFSNYVKAGRHQPLNRGDSASIAVNRCNTRSPTARLPWVRNTSACPRRAIAAACPRSAISGANSACA